MAPGVLLHQLAHLLRIGIEGQGQLGVLAGERLPVLPHVRAYLVVLGQYPRGVAVHARQPRLDGTIRAARIAHDGGRPLVDALVARVDEAVRLQAVGQVEDRLAPGVLEAGVAQPRPERVGEDVAPVGKQDVPLDEVLRDGLEIVGAPVCAVHGVVALEDAVVSRDARAVESRPRDALLLDVQGGIDAQLPFEVGEVGGHLEQVVVERGARGRRHEPIGPHDGQARGRGHQHGAGDAGIRHHAVGIIQQQAVPEAGVPEDVAQVDAEDEAGGVDGLGKGDARMPGQAVEQLGESLAEGGQLVRPVAGVGQRHQGEVAGEAPVPPRHFLQVGEDPIQDGVLGDERGLRLLREGRSAGGDPVAQRGDLSGRGTMLGAGGRHLAGGDAREERRAGRIAGHDLAAGHQLVAVKDEVEAALDRAVPAVAAVAVGTKDGEGPRGQRRRRGSGENGRGQRQQSQDSAAPHRVSSAGCGALFNPAAPF